MNWTKLSELEHGIRTIPQVEFMMGGFSWHPSPRWVSRVALEHDKSIPGPQRPNGFPAARSLDPIGSAGGICSRSDSRFRHFPDFATSTSSGITAAARLRRQIRGTGGSARRAIRLVAKCPSPKGSNVGTLCWLKFALRFCSNCGDDRFGSGAE